MTKHDTTHPWDDAKTIKRKRGKGIEATNRKDRRTRKDENER